MDSSNLQVDTFVSCRLARARESPGRSEVAKLVEGLYCKVSAVDQDTLDGLSPNEPVQGGGFSSAGMPEECPRSNSSSSGTTRDALLRLCLKGYATQLSLCLSNSVVVRITWQTCSDARARLPQAWQELILVVCMRSLKGLYQ